MAIHLAKGLLQTLNWIWLRWHCEVWHICYTLACTTTLCVSWYYWQRQIWWCGRTVSFKSLCYKRKVCDQRNKANQPKLRSYKFARKNMLWVNETQDGCEGGWFYIEKLIQSSPGLCTQLYHIISLGREPASTTPSDAALTCDDGRLSST